MPVRLLQAEAAADPGQLTCDYGCLAVGACPASLALAHSVHTGATAAAGAASTRVHCSSSSSKDANVNTSC
jgi:hypothetical protein